MPSIDRERRVINDPNAPLPTKIAAAAVLWALIDDAKDVLEAFKASVRTVAVATGQTTVTLNGDGMSQCKVVLPGPSLKLNEDFREVTSRNVLGHYFDVLFETKVQLRNGDPSFIATFPAIVTNHMATVTTLVPSTPRVSLKSLAGVEEVK